MSGLGLPYDADSKLIVSWMVGDRDAETAGLFIDDLHISTSFTERHNLTMRMQMRRFTRLTNGFSKRIDNHCHSLSLYFVWYNWCRIHKTLRVSPAMAAGLTDELMDLSDIAALVESAVPKPGKRGPYKKRVAA